MPTLVASVACVTWARVHDSGDIHLLPIAQSTGTLSTTISVDRKTRDFLARRKKALEDGWGSPLTWDEFFERALGVTEPPKLTNEEIEGLEKNVREARP